jgi:hypothetical protein
MGADISSIGAYNHWSPLADYTSPELAKLSDTEMQNNIFASAMGYQKKIFNLQQNEKNIEEEINQINYKIQKFYNRLLIAFAIMMVIIPSLLFIIIIKSVYHYYQNTYLSNQRNKINE